MSNPIQNPYDPPKTNLPDVEGLASIAWIVLLVFLLFPVSRLPDFLFSIKQLVELFRVLLQK